MLSHRTRTSRAQAVQAPPLTVVEVRAGLLNELRGARQQDTRPGQVWSSALRSPRRSRTGWRAY
jgi:hypothetical protein